MNKSLYWYDLETSGTDPRWDRIVQFAGLRTNEDLEIVGDEYSTYVRLPADVLPNPDASLVTGITPQLTHRQGIGEWQALTKIQRLFAQPQTCVAGFNSLRFDDEFIRYGFYRMLLDPYTREWQNGNSRWDIIDLVRATGTLRPEGMQWPTDENGLRAYKLEWVTQANHLEHGQAHDAMSDVQATLALAQLIRRKQPRLFDYYFNLRSKKQVRKLLEPYGARICVHVSGMYSRDRHSCAPIVSVARHPVNGNSIIVADLSADIDGLLHWPEEQLREALFTPGSNERPPLKEVRINKCPFIAASEVLTVENLKRFGWDMDKIEERQRRLRKPGIADKIMRVYGARQHSPTLDVDAALYDGFLAEDDRSRCAALQEELHANRWVSMDFGDKRLHTLSARLKARSFGDRMSAPEKEDWHAFVGEKLNAEQVPWLTLNALEKRINELCAEDPNVNPVVVEELRAHLEHLRAIYPRRSD